MRTTGNIVRQVEAVYLDGMLGTWSDDRLLDRFTCEAGDRAERAFAAIVERHGPRVYRVCRGVAGDVPTAEDAFQATFLVLARKAGTLRVRESLGPWLHGVAARLAASARSAQARRRRHETAVAHRGEPSTTDPERDPDLCRILHAEIGRLPAAYREAVYLCDVEGLSQETVAVRLSCAIGTVRSRLSRGRKRLRSRLIRRGIVPAAVAALASRASAALPVRLVDAAARNAVAITSGGAAGGMVPAAVAALFQEAITAMIQTKLRMIFGAAIVGLTATAAVVFAQDAQPGAKPEPTKQDAERTAKIEPRPDDTETLPDLPGSVVKAARFLAVPEPTNSSFVLQGMKQASGTVSKIPEEKPQANDPFHQEAATRLGINQVSSDEPIGLARDRVEVLNGGDEPRKPTLKELGDAILNQKFPDLRYRIEKIGEKVDPVKVYPLAGPCQLVHLHYKATICYTLPGREVGGHEEEIFLHRDYLRRAPNKGTVDAGVDSKRATGRPSRLDGNSLKRRQDAIGDPPTTDPLTVPPGPDPIDSQIRREFFTNPEVTHLRSAKDEAVKKFDATRARVQDPRNSEWNGARQDVAEAEQAYNDLWKVMYPVIRRRVLANGAIEGTTGVRAVENRPERMISDGDTDLLDPARSPTPAAGDSERRLSDVEHKLDRILKALEKDEPKTKDGSKLLRP